MTLPRSEIQNFYVTQNSLLFLAGQPMCVYGDPAYPLRVHLQGPFKYGVLTNQLKAYNASMSAVFRLEKKC